MISGSYDSRDDGEHNSVGLVEIPVRFAVNFSLEQNYLTEYTPWMP